MIDLLVANGQAVRPGYGIRAIDVGIKDGCIAGLYQKGAAPEAARTIDATGLHILPGAVDPHIHLGGYQPLEQEFRAGTESAALGGVTTIVNYFKAIESYHSLVPGYIDTCQRLGVIDFAFHLQLLSEIQLDQLEECVAEYGISSYKINLFWKGKEKAVFNSDRTIDEGWMHSILLRMAKLGPAFVLNVHSENMDLRNERIHRLKAESRDTLEFYDQMSPDFAETSSMLSALYLSKITGGRVYIVHLSAGSSVEALANMPWLTGNGNLVETCPHYLTQTIHSPIGLQGTVNPPLRGERDAELLWQGIRDGLISCVGSDSNPLMLDRKMGTDIWTNKPGFDGVGCMLPLMLDQGYHRRGLPLERIVEVCSLEPAKAFGLYPRKGTVEVGSDADLAVIDLNLERTISPQMLDSPCDFSIYDGWKVKGWPAYTVSRGEVIADHGKVLGKPGRGRYLSRR